MTLQAPDGFPTTFISEALAALTDGVSQRDVGAGVTRRSRPSAHCGLVPAGSAFLRVMPADIGRARAMFCDWQEMSGADPLRLALVFLTSAG